MFSAASPTVIQKKVIMTCSLTLHSSGLVTGPRDRAGMASEHSRGATLRFSFRSASVVARGFLLWVRGVAGLGCSPARLPLPYRRVCTARFLSTRCRPRFPLLVLASMARCVAPGG